MARLAPATFGLLIVALTACAMAAYRVTATVTPATGIAGSATDFLVARGYLANLESMGPWPCWSTGATASWTGSRCSSTRWKETGRPAPRRASPRP